MLDVSDPSVQALRIEDTQFDLSDIEPASVLGCIDELEPIPECLRYLWRESLIERPGRMHVQIIHHQRNLFGLSVMIINRLEESSPILSGSSLSNLYHPSPGKWFTCEEDAACAAAAVFIIVSGRLSW